MVFHRDPCGVFCILLSYIFILYVDYALVFHLILPTFSVGITSFLLCLIYNIFTLLLTMSHLTAVTSDPGIVPFPEHALDLPNSVKQQGYKNTTKDGWSVCVKCSMYRPPRAHHCRICKRCINKMDHHCPWINNCVGEYNQKFFIQFLFYVGLSSVYSLSMILISWLNDPKGKSHTDHQKKIMHSIIIGTVSVLFGLFVFAIFFDQIQSILSDTTTVEYLKSRKPKPIYKTNHGLLMDVFGSGPVYFWLLPCYYLLNPSASAAMDLNRLHNIDPDPEKVFTENENSSASTQTVLTL